LLRGYQGSFLMKNRFIKYVVYHLRWQLSAIVMMIPLLIFESLGILNNQFFRLMILQFFGALIFWNIDKFIFSYKEGKKITNTK